MSDYIELSMAKADSELEAYRLAKKFSESLKNNAEEYLMKDEYFIQRIINGHKDIEERIRDLFTRRFIYWPKHKLIAVIGQYYPNECRKLFPFDACYQTSSDRDDEYEAFDGLGFDDIIEKCKVMTKEEILKEETFLNSDDIDEEDKDELDYWRRTVCSDAIYEKELSICDVLYEKDNDNFIRFSMNAINGPLDYSRNIHPILRKNFMKPKE